MTEILLEYPYKPRTGMMLAGIAFFGAGAADMAHTAITNNRGLILNGIFRFSVSGATVFYWCMAAVCMLFVLGAIVGLAMSLRKHRFVRLTRTDLSFPPHAFARKAVTIALSDIAHIKLQTIKKDQFINIYHLRGRSSVTQSMLPNPDAFKKLHDALVASVAGKNRK